VRLLARAYVGDLHPRWEHLAAAGRTADRLRARSTALVPPHVAQAVWVHDIGYVERLAATGFHPLDGARFLRRIGFPDEVTALVAWHTHAQHEARLRGLLAELADFPYPDQDALDLVTMIDLATSPQGLPVRDVDRLREIVGRHGDASVVSASVIEAHDDLLAASARAKRRLGLSLSWPTGSDGAAIAGQQGDDAPGLVPCIGYPTTAARR